MTKSTGATATTVLSESAADSGKHMASNLLAVASVVAAMRCPLCRRTHTVIPTGQESEYQCTYDGCRGYTWSEAK